MFHFNVMRKNNRMDNEILQVYLKVYGLETNNIIDIDIEFEISEAFFIT